MGSGERLPVLGPFPCGAVRCSCTKGGCDHLGALSEAAKEAIAASREADREREGVDG